VCPNETEGRTWFTLNVSPSCMVPSSPIWFHERSIVLRVCEKIVENEDVPEIRVIVVPGLLSMLRQCAQLLHHQCCYPKGTVSSESVSGSDNDGTVKISGGTYLVQSQRVGKFSSSFGADVIAYEINCCECL
jgi:hypothetical protein